MNLKQGNGLVPIRNYRNNESPYLLVKFPNEADFKSLYRASITQDTLDKYRALFQARMAGATLEQAGKLFDISRERVRQIEAKFLRALARRYAHQPTPSSTTEKP